MGTPDQTAQQGRFAPPPDPIQPQVGRAVPGEPFSKQLRLPLLMLVVVVYAYANSFAGQFIYDDYISIVDNPGIRSLSASLQGTSRPLTNLTFAINYLLSNKPADYHLVNLLIHLANMLLLFGVVRRTLELPSLVTGNPAILAGLVALLWAVHPLQTECVTYIVQRAESLMAMFFLATLYFSIWGFTSVNGGRWVALACVVCALGMLAKPVMITAPLIVLCYDRFFVSRSFVAALKGRPRFYAALAFSWLLLAVILSRPNESSTSAGFDSATVTPLHYWATQAGVVLHYLRLSLWPKPLCLDYAWEPVSSIASALAPITSIGVFLAVTVWGVARNKPLGFLGVCFFLILMPTSSFLPLGDCAAEHRMYLPLAAIIICGVMFIARLLALRLQVVLFVPVIYLLVAMTIARNGDYQSERGMWQRVLDVRPDNVRAYFGKGAALLKANDLDPAEACFREVLKRVPDEQAARRRGILTDYVLVLNDLGVIAFKRGDLTTAESYFLKSSTCVKSNPSAEQNLLMVRQAEAKKQSGGSKP